VCPPRGIEAGNPKREIRCIGRFLLGEPWMQVRPNRSFPGECTLAIDQEEPAVVVKSVFQTAAFAGYPRVSFLVHKLDGAAP
jgi:hypothetical protein